MKLPVLPALLLLAGALAARPLEIERLDLPGMVSKADDGVVAVIRARHTFHVDDPVAGPDLIYTTLRLEGHSLYDGRTLTVDVTYPSGDPERGIWNSEEPSADDVRIGNRVVAFYKWSDDMGGHVAANALYASHGGLYRTAHSPGSDSVVVLGRGDGYAIDGNVKLDALESSIRTLADQKKSEKKKE